MLISNNHEDGSWDAFLNSGAYTNTLHFNAISHMQY